MKLINLVIYLIVCKYLQLLFVHFLMYMCTVVHLGQWKIVNMYSVTCRYIYDVCTLLVLLKPKVFFQ